jgi:hypothetical protein
MYAAMAMAVAISLGLRSGIREAWWRMPVAVIVPALLVREIWPPLASSRPLATACLYALAAVLFAELIAAVLERGWQSALGRQNASSREQPAIGLRIAGALWRGYQSLSAGVLAIALCATAYSLLFLPWWSGADWPPSERPPMACWIDGHIVPVVGCLGTGADPLIGGLLTFSMAWTLNAPLIVDEAFVRIGRFGMRGDLPVSFFWLLSLFAAAGMLARVLRRRRRAP